VRNSHPVVSAVQDGERVSQMDGQRMNSCCEDISESRYFASFHITRLGISIHLRHSMGTGIVVGAGVN
jgi:hypothetical protein